LLEFQLNFWIYLMGAFAATKADPNPDPAKKSASESIKNSPLGAGPIKF